MSKHKDNLPIYLSPELSKEVIQVCFKLAKFTNANTEDVTIDTVLRLAIKALNDRIDKCKPRDRLTSKIIKEVSSKTLN